MVAIEYSQRQRMIDSCLEAKPFLKLECPTNISSYNVFDWQTRKKEDIFDNCTDIYNIYHHPVAKTMIGKNLR